MAMDFLSAFQPFADLEPMPQELACRFTLKFSSGRGTAARIDQARQWLAALERYTGPKSFAWERMVEETNNARQWLRPEFSETLLDVALEEGWGHQSGRIQVILPNCYRLMVDSSSPFENTGQTVVNQHYVFNSWQQAGDTWTFTELPLYKTTSAEVVLAHVEPRILFGGWVIERREETPDGVVLFLRRRYPIGSAPDTWEEDWPVLYFTEADRVVVTIDRGERVITGWESLYEGSEVSAVQFTDIDTNPNLTPEDFDPITLGLWEGPR